MVHRWRWLTTCRRCGWMAGRTAGRWKPTEMMLAECPNCHGTRAHDVSDVLDHEAWTRPSEDTMTGEDVPASPGGLSEAEMRRRFDHGEWLIEQAELGDEPQIGEPAT